MGLVFEAIAVCDGWEMLVCCIVCLRFGKLLQNVDGFIHSSENGTSIYDKHDKRKMIAVCRKFFLHPIKTLDNMKKAIHLKLNIHLLNVFKTVYIPSR